MKELYGVGILFFYFLKWPVVIGYPYLRLNGLNNNYIIDLLWLYCLFLIFKDLYMFIQKRKKESSDSK